MWDRSSDPASPCRRFGPASGEVIGEIEGSALKLQCRLPCGLLGVANCSAFAYLGGDGDTTANLSPNARRKCTTTLNWGSLFGLNER